MRDVGDEMIGTGGGSTEAIVTVCVAGVVPGSPITVRVKVVDDALSGPEVTGVPDVTLPTPLLIEPVPLAKTKLRVVESPLVTVDLVEENDVMTGCGGGLRFAIVDPPPPHAEVNRDRPKARIVR